MTTFARWVAKKSARQGLALATRGVTLMRPSAVPQCRVLTYHRFAATRRDPFAVTPEQFRRQMAWLAATGRVASLTDLQATLAGTPLTRDAVVVTIDDGVRSVFDHALPILREFQIPAVVFVTASLVGAGRDGRALDPVWLEPFMTWSEVAALVEGGLTIGSHAWTHRSLANRPAGEIQIEAQRSKTSLERELGIGVDAFAYPFGTRADYSDSIAAVLSDCGYSTAFTSQHGPITASDDPMQLPRVKVEGGEGLWLFRLLAAGALDSWRLIDQSLWRLQARHG